ncbi:MAG: DUF1850 domain-containing protein [Clostridia bacterium]|nr:DUF1850 domain-containing protein [Clostridia bacterium]
MNRKSAGKNAMEMAAVVLCAIAAILFLMRSGLFGGAKLRLIDADTGEQYAAYSVEEGDLFSVSFLHSVNKSLVKETYRISLDENMIFVESCEYSAFGAGVATQVEEGQTLSYTPEGHMLLSGIHQKIPHLSYIVGTVYDHILEIHGQQINLRELCGKNSTVSFVLAN